jgi:2,3-bisphosphoglycerate-dependent phosphoglycerate mutase
LNHILIVARHGNTFNSDEPPRRIGRKTDIDLVANGIEQARNLGKALVKLNFIPNKVYSAVLKRSANTTKIALETAGLSSGMVEYSPLFDEIDYGPDENKLESEVIERIGEEGIRRWNAKGIVPPLWEVDVTAIKNSWLKLAEQIASNQQKQTCLVVTSNGIARFSPVITGDLKKFSESYNLKIATGAMCIFEYVSNSWEVKEWNLKTNEIDLF